MKYIFILFLACFTILGCKKDPVSSTTLTLNFKAVYDSEPLLFDLIKEYSYYDGTAVKFNDLRFFLSHVKLYSGGEATQILEIDHVDFTSINKTIEGAVGGQSIVIGDPVAGTYDKVEFSIGVPAELNSLNNDYGYDHPLGPGNIDEQWISWGNYTFAKIEGRQDADNDGMFKSFTYHTGMDEMYRTRTITKTISIEENQDNTIIFEVNAKRIFSNGTDVIDIVVDDKVFASPSTPSTMLFGNAIADNLINSISIK